jgi:hypothetical protein
MTVLTGRPKTMTANFYIVTTPEAAFFFIGLARRDGSKVQLCAPDGRQVFTVHHEAVRQITKEQFAADMLAERRAALAARN